MDRKKRFRRISAGITVGITAIALGGMVSVAVRYLTGELFTAVPLGYFLGGIALVWLFAMVCWFFLHRWIKKEFFS